MSTALVIAGAFLLGSFPTGVLVARARDVDLRRIGSGNIGASNVGRALGKRWAVLVLLVDAAKGALPAWVAREPLSAPPLVVAAAGVCAVLGHSFSVFLKGRGGKGVATTLGAALVMAPLAAAASFVLYAVLYLAFRISSVGSLAAVTAFPLLAWLIDPSARATWLFGLVVAALVVARHKDNIRRLLRGEELKAP